jgi:hypothetical protein
VYKAFGIVTARLIPATQAVEATSRRRRSWCDRNADNPVADHGHCGVKITLRAARLCGDNTFATPCFQLPFGWDTDIVVHSVTNIWLAIRHDTGRALAKDAAIFELIKSERDGRGAVTV